MTMQTMYGIDQVASEGFQPDPPDWVNNVTPRLHPQLAWSVQLDRDMAAVSSYTYFTSKSSSMRSDMGRVEICGSQEASLWYSSL